MVMKRNAMAKNLRQSILGSLGRYLAIMAIIALGAGIFVGLRMTRADMVATGQVYTDDQNMFDLRLVSSYGWARDQLPQIAELEGVEEAEGLFYIDLIAGTGGEEAVYRFYSMPQSVNRLALLGGRMPENRNECVVDGFRRDDSILGAQLTLSRENDADSLEAMTTTTFTVVGYVGTPLYMDLNRGNTSVGNGSISSCLFVPEDAFDVDYYTEIHVTIPGDHSIYSDAYNDTLDAAADALELQLDPLAQERLERLRQEAEEEYADGLEEYRDGVREYEDGKADVVEELRDALKELTDGEKELADYEQRLTDGEKQIADAKVSIPEGRKTLSQSRQTLAQARVSAYDQISQQSQDMMDEIEFQRNGLEDLTAEALDLSTELLSLETEIMQLELEQSQLDMQIQQVELLIQYAGEEELEGYYAQLAQLQAQREECSAQLQELYAQRSELQNRQSQLEREMEQYQSVIDSLQSGIAEAASQLIQMEQQFAAAEAQLEAGQVQLDSYEEELVRREQEIADGWISLEEGKRELADGWVEFWDGMDEANTELNDAARELRDAEQELRSARQTIDDMTENSVYVLDRNSNIGYSSLDSSSDIVAGVSKVFPAFFLLVASLVCITTMTRMVDEERTQIGTLKALGYSNAAIIRKYLFYAGSSAVSGCGLGVILGSIIFPTILWEVYKIMIFIPRGVVLEFDWALCLAVVASYTGAMLLATWYCCRKALQEVPAELIRPKAPTAGKQLLLEKLPFWRKVSFLNKVTIRNIFRYHQRLAMMMVGIGGCTALLLTGFGLRDSIERIVDIQFEEVTLYDLSVSFRDDQSEGDQQAFRDDLAPYASDVLFCNQVSMELDADGQTREIYVMTTPAEITDFIDFHSGTRKLDLPGQNEVLLSVGVAETLGIQVGDTVTLRNTDLEQLTLTVSGLYDNHVYNYGVVTQGTVQEQWGRMPEQQMAFVKVQNSQDVHSASAAISGVDDVMNVSINEDLAAMVNSMMEALDLVVVVVVICAGLLGATVLYNLTNININERIREIATIKVLGFNAMETAMYIFKENLSLTAIGSLLGLGLGRLLLAFVMSQIKIDFVWFQARLLLPSYLLSILLTLLTAALVDLVFYFRLDKINMAEALKSVE